MVAPKSSMLFAGSFSAVLLIPLLYSFSFAGTHPEPPQSITSVNYQEESNRANVVQAYVAIGLVPGNNYSDFDPGSILYHTVLVNDLSISFDQVRAKGNYDNGVFVSFSDRTLPIKVPVSKSPRRYFVAVSVSGIRADDQSEERLYSGWRVYVSASGMPVTIAVDSTRNEDLYIRTVNVGNAPGQMISYLRFSGRVGDRDTVTITRNNVPVLKLDNLEGISQGGTLQVSDNIASALLQPLANAGQLLLRRTGSGTSGVIFYDLFSIVPKNTVQDSFTIQLRNFNNQTVVRPLRGGADDPEFSDIVSTIYTLLRLPENTTDPIQGTPALRTLSDSLTLKMLSAATAWLAIAHSSQKNTVNEMRAGIFSNYIQFMDNIARKYLSIGASDTGVARLQAMYEEIEEQNKGIIMEPLQVTNKGTAAEFGKAIKKRKNYTFYDGYSRLDCEIKALSYDFSPATLTVAGILFRISENVSLYKANLADTNNMFKAPFLTGGPAARRVIIAVNDTLFKNIDTAGVWVKGRHTSTFDTLYYTGACAVRLGLKAMGPSYTVGTPFIISKEGKGQSDPVGSIAGGPEKSVVTTQLLFKETNDSVSNIDAKVVQKNRTIKFTYNKEYKEMENTIKFTITGKDNQPIPAAFTESSAIVDSIPGSDACTRIKVLSKELRPSGRQEGSPQMVRVNEKNMISLRNLGLKNPQGTETLELWGTDLIAVAIDKEIKDSLRSSAYNGRIITISCSPKLEVYKQRSDYPKTPLIPYYGKKKVGDTRVFDIPLEKYCAEMLSTDSIFFIGETGNIYKFEVIMKNENPDTKECNQVVRLYVPKVILHMPKAELYSGAGYGYDLETRAQRNAVSIKHENFISLATKADKSPLYLYIMPFKENIYTVTSSNEALFDISPSHKNVANGKWLLELDGKEKDVTHDSAWLKVSVKNIPFDSVRIHVYKEAVISQVVPVFLYDSTSAKTDTTDAAIRAMIDKTEIEAPKFLRHGVIKLDRFAPFIKISIPFDTNKNGAFDTYEKLIPQGVTALHHPSAASALDVRTHEKRVLNAFFDQYIKYDSVNTCIYFLKRIKHNIRLAKRADSGSNKICLEEINPSMKFYKKFLHIGHKDHYIGNSELIFIDDIARDTCSFYDTACKKDTFGFVLNSALKENHDTNHTIFLGICGLAFPSAGVSVISCETPTDEIGPTVAHELLHLNQIAGLLDVNNTENLMHYKAENIDYLLRYRGQQPCKTADGEPLDVPPQNQWNLIKRK